MLVSLLKLIAVLVFVTILLGLWSTWKMEHSANEQAFLKGTVPNPRPEGLYAGSVPGHTVSWLGKKFDAVHEMGINVFDDGGGVKGERYPFATSVGFGVRDKTLNVFKIDYNIPQNPFWLKPILDEIVQVAPGQYLGKLQVRILPGYPFTLAYFELKK